VSPMIPDLQSSFACEDIRQERSGSHTIVGILNGIAAPALPVRMFKICVWTRWCSGSGTYKQRTRLMAPDEKTVMAQAENEFTLQNPESHATNVNIFGGVEFAQEGLCHFEIELDGKLRLRYPLRVHILEQPA